MIILLKSVGQIPKQVVFSYPQGWEKKMYETMYYILNMLSAPLCPPYWGQPFCLGKVSINLCSKTSQNG